MKTKSYIKIKQSWLTLFVAALLGCSVLVGTTLAAFSAAVSSPQNAISAGALSFSAIGKKSLEKKSLETETEIDFMEGVPLFDGAALSIDEKAERYIEVKNEGNVPLQYSIVATKTTEDGDDVQNLADVLQCYVTPVPSEGDANAFSGEGPLSFSERKQLAFVENAVLAPGETAVWRIACGLSERTSPNYRGAELGMDISVYASQTGETSKVIPVYSALDITTTDPAVLYPTFVLMNDITVPAEEIVLSQYANFDFNGYTLTGDLTIDLSDSDVGVGTIDIGSATLYNQHETQHAQDTAVAVGAAVGALNGKLTVKAPNAVVNQYISCNTVAIDSVATYYLYEEQALPSLAEEAATEDLVQVSIAQGKLVLYRAVPVAVEGEAVVVVDARSLSEQGDTDAALSIQLADSLSDGSVSIFTTPQQEPSLALIGRQSIATVSTKQESAPVPEISLGSTPVVTDKLTAETTFLEDLKSAKTGDTVRLTGNVQLEKNLFIYGKAIHIDLNGYNLVINGAFLLDYSNVSVPKTTWYSIGDGTITAIKNGKPQYSRPQEGMLQANAFGVVAGGGNISIRCKRPAQGFNFIAGGVEMKNTNGQMIQDFSSQYYLNGMYPASAFVDGTFGSVTGLMAQETVTIR